MTTRPVRDWVALVLAIGLAVAINMITAAMFVAALHATEPTGMSENATQVLTTAFGGIVGVLGSYVGYRIGARERGRDARDNSESDPPGQ